MGAKDITKKTLEAYNDVFSDIVNGLLFHGKQLVQEDLLTDAQPVSMYKADSGIHEQERDVSKYWVKTEGGRINVFEIARLPKESVDYFHSDFKVVVDYFVGKREDPDYRPRDPEKFKHVDELLKLMSVLTHDSRFEDVLKEEGGKPKDMCEVLDRVESRGEIKGVIKLYRDEMNLLPSEIVNKIMLRFSLDRKKAEKYVEETLGLELA